MRIINEKEEKEICDEYIQGLSMTNIAKMRHCSQPRIKNILIKHNVALRKRRVNSNLKENYFEVIDTPNKAYLLGLIFTDGSVTEESGRQNQLRLELKATDVELLELYRTELGISSKLTYSKRKNSESFLSSVRSDKIVKDLNKYGVVKNKTYITDKLPIIEETLQKDFLRGLIDGDGSIALRMVIIKLILHLIQKIFVKILLNYAKKLLESIQEQNLQKMETHLG